MAGKAKSAVATQNGQFSVRFTNFNEGAAPLAHLDSLTEVGNGGHYSSAQNVDVLSFPGLLTQGPGLSTLTNGTESGAVGELINYIIDRPVTSGVTYGIAASKLHQISATTVTNSGNWPHSITGATSGSSVTYFQGNIYYFFNKSVGGDIGKYDLSSSFTDAWGSVVPTGASALLSAPHPIATKQDIMLFGNGRYVGTYNATSNILATTKLDFGNDATTADIAFQANQWWIAINSGSGVSTDRQSASIFLYDPSASASFLTDEIAVGVQKIGFLMPIEGIMYVAFQDVSTAGGFCIGYVNGRSIKPLRYFTGSLPTFAQKTLYANTITFIANNQVYSVGAVIESLPVQVSQLASGGYSTVGAIAAPFGTPMVASTQSTSFKLAKFSGYDVSCNWRSIVIPTAQGILKGYIDRIVVLTRTLASGARCDLIVEGDQATKTGSTQQITGTGKRRFVFNSLALTSLEDFRIFLNWANGSTSNPVKIREIQVQGHYLEQR